MAQIRLLNGSIRTIKEGDPVKIHATRKNTFDYANLGDVAIGHSSQIIPKGGWGVINLIGHIAITPALIEEIATKIPPPIPGPKGDTGLAGEPGRDGYTPIKGIDYFDGDQGIQGLPGVDGIDGIPGLPGQDGTDGYTPIKGVDYFDGLQGPKGDTGGQGLQGIPGNDGQDGADGYTPIKGVDYFDGVKGDKGDTGERGLQGEQGIQGIPGINGSDANVGLHESTYNHLNYNTAYSHSQVAHAPSNAQANADITKAEIEAKLTGPISTHSHSGGADPFIAKLVLGADKPTGANVTPVTLGLTFDYEANSKYIIDMYMIVAPTVAGTGCGFMIDVSSVVTYVATHVTHQLAITGTLSGASSIGDLAATSSGVSSGMVSTASQFVRGGGILITGANTGTATFYFRSETTAVTTCKANSIIRIMKV